MSGWTFTQAHASIPESAQLALYQACDAGGRARLLRDAPSLSEAVIREVVRSRQRDAITTILSRDDLSESVLVRLARAGGSRVRALMLRRSELSPETVAICAGSDTPAIWKAAFYHPNCPEGIRDRILAGRSCKPRGRSTFAVPSDILSPYSIHSARTYVLASYARAADISTTMILAQQGGQLPLLEQARWALRVCQEGSRAQMCVLLEAARRLPQLTCLQEVCGWLGETDPQARDAQSGFRARFPETEFIDEARNRLQSALDALTEALVDTGEGERADTNTSPDTSPSDTTAPTGEDAQSTPAEEEPVLSFVEQLRSLRPNALATLSSPQADLDWDELTSAHVVDALPQSVCSRLVRRPEVPGAFLDAIIPTYPGVAGRSPSLTHAQALRLLGDAANSSLWGTQLAQLRVSGRELCAHTAPAREVFSYLEDVARDTTWQERAAHEISTRIGEELGDDPSRWGTYLHLLESFDGTLDELLELVCAAC